jgi:hypothetical protein
MKYKKSQVTVPITGKTMGVRPLGLIAAADLERDMEEVRERFSGLALHGVDILTVEVTDTTVVAVYKSGVVRVVRWEEEP